MCSDMIAILKRMDDATREVMGTKQIGGIKYRPRSTNKQLRKIRNRMKALRAITSGWEVGMVNIPEFDPLAAQAAEEGPEWAAQQLTETLATLKDMCKQERKEEITKRREQLQELYRTDKKRAHKWIRKSQIVQQQQIDYVYHPDTNNLCQDQDEVVEAFQAYYTNLFNPERKPNNVAPYPWELPGAADPFKMVPRNTHNPHYTMDIISNPALLRDRIKRLPNNKAPGPDGVICETLALLPDTVIEVLAHFMGYIYAVGASLPEDLTASITILLPKNGQTALMKNYMPIGLANTLLKLYTMTLTEAFGDVLEAEGLLNTAQEGFRRQRSTIRQLRRIINAIDDAHISQQNLYILYVDFSSAFNMVNHQKLYKIMTDLGMPQSFIRAVQSIYATCSTTIHTPAGPTRSIRVTRGTIQGDCLSPLLFLIYIEPLLRWLQVGGRGYRYGCLTPEQNQHLHTAHATFADDLAMLTGTHQKMGTQVSKLNSYGDWADLPPNSTKCKATGILHGDKKTGSLPVATDGEVIQRRLMPNCILSNGETPQYLPPHLPYEYLGVKVTLTGHWHHQIKHSIQKLQERLHNVIYCGLL